MSVNWNEDDHPRGGDGKWVNSDSMRDDHGQVLDSLYVAQATGDEYGAERAEFHLQEAAIRELAEMDRDIPLCRTEDGTWQIADEPIDGLDPNDFDADEYERINELVSTLHAHEVEGIGTPIQYRVETDYYTDDYSVTPTTVLSSKRLAHRASVENWAVAADQPALFDTDDVPFEPTEQTRSMSERDPDEVVARGYVPSADGSQMEFTELKVSDFKEASEGVHRNVQGGYVVLDPWREQQLPQRLQTADGLHHDSELDQYVPFRAVTDADKKVLTEWRGKRYTGSDNYQDNLTDRALLARNHAERAERVEVMLREHNVDVGFDSATVADYPVKGKQWPGFREVSDTQQTDTAYLVEPEANSRIPEGYRNDDGLYTGQQALIVDAVLHPDEQEARNAIMVLNDYGHYYPERFKF